MTADDTAAQPVFTRRNALLGAASAGVALPLLAACGGSEDAVDNTPAGGTGASGAVLGPTSDIPVGGGKVYGDESVVVTQPTAGQYKGFSAICTHESCLVGSVADGKIQCPCHGSQYSATDGSVIQGPATRALPEVDVTVTGGNVTLS